MTGDWFRYLDVDYGSLESDLKIVGLSSNSIAALSNVFIVDSRGGVPGYFSFNRLDVIGQIPSSKLIKLILSFKLPSV